MRLHDENKKSSKLQAPSSKLQAPSSKLQAPLLCLMAVLCVNNFAPYAFYAAAEDPLHQELRDPEIEQLYAIESTHPWNTLAFAQQIVQNNPTKAPMVAQALFDLVSNPNFLHNPTKIEHYADAIMAMDPTKRHDLIKVLFEEMPTRPWPTSYADAILKLDQNQDRALKQLLVQRVLNQITSATQYYFLGLADWVAAQDATKIPQLVQNFLTRIPEENYIFAIQLAKWVVNHDATKVPELAQELLSRMPTATTSYEALEAAKIVSQDPTKTPELINYLIAHPIDNSPTAIELADWIIQQDPTKLTEVVAQMISRVPAAGSPSDIYLADWVVRHDPMQRNAMVNAIIARMIASDDFMTNLMRGRFIISQDVGKIPEVVRIMLNFLLVHPLPAGWFSGIADECRRWLRGLSDQQEDAVVVELKTHNVFDPFIAWADTAPQNAIAEVQALKNMLIDMAREEQLRRTGEQGLLAHKLAENSQFPYEAASKVTEYIYGERPEERPVKFSTKEERLALRKQQRDDQLTWASSGLSTSMFEERKARYQNEKSAYEDAMGTGAKPFSEIFKDKYGEEYYDPRFDE